MALESAEHDIVLEKSFEHLLERMKRKAKITLKPGEKGKKSPLVVQRKKDGTFMVEVDEREFTAENFNRIAAQAIAKIESLELLAKLQGDERYRQDLKLFRDRATQPAHRRFYDTMFQTIAVHNAAVHLPILREKLAEISEGASKSLTTSTKKIPLHIQFLLSLMGGNITSLDPRVREAIFDLNSAGILGFIKHVDNPIGEKLQRINDDIFPLYEYFLREDKLNWKKQKKEKKPEEIQEETHKKVEEKLESEEGAQSEDESEEETQEEANSTTEEKGQESDEAEEGESGEGQSGEGESGEGESGEGESGEGESGEGESGEGEKQKKPKDKSSDATPDHQSGYNPDESGQFEDDPDGEGYQLEISPHLKGYYSADRKNRFSHKSLLEWDYDTQYSPYAKNSEFKGEKHTISGTIKGIGIKSIPVPNEYALDISSLTYSGDKPKILRDQNGNFFFQIQKECTFSIDFYHEKKPFVARPTAEDRAPIYHGITLSNLGETALKKAQQAPSSFKKAEIIRDYIRQNHKYPQGKDDKQRLNAAKATQIQIRKMSANSSQYIQNLDNAKYLECYSSNTLMVGMLRSMGIASRVVTGHHVTSINKEGNGVINSANAHGWCEIWDGSEWVRFDATPPGDPNEKEKDEQKKDQKNEEKGQPSKAESAQDGGEDTPPTPDENKEKGEEGEKKKGESSDGEGGEKGEGDGGESGDEGGDSASEGQSAQGEGEGEGSSSSQGGEGGGEAQEDDLDDRDAFDPEAEFEKMYKELEDYIAETPEEKEVQELMDQEPEQIDTSTPEAVDPIEQMIEDNYPELRDGEKEDMRRFVEHFLRESEGMKRIPNPNAKDDPEHPMLIDVLRSIMDRVISRSVVEEDVPRYPVSDGDILMDPVGLYFDEQAGLSDSSVWLRQEMEEHEQMRVVKVRRRKVLDGSGSMQDGVKLNLQQLIETLENIVTAEKQKELEVISQELDRDVRLETETWQFGVSDPKGEFVGFRRLKKLAPEFDEVEQAMTWYASGQAAGGTNDYDPLEQIYKEILEEEALNRTKNPDSPSVLDSIKVGFCIRELKNLEELQQKSSQELSQQEAVYYRNLLANEEGFRTFLDQIKAQYPDIEPMIEVIEVTSDGGSNSSPQVQEAIRKLRALGVIVVAYGLGSDGGAVETTYANTYNPLEGGYHCVNLLDYPTKKMMAWERILDKV